MARRSESDYREVAFEREGKEPLHGFMRVDRGMVIVRGYGGHIETRETERILHLRWEHVDLERGLIFMPDSKSGRKAIMGTRLP